MNYCYKGGMNLHKTFEFQFVICKMGEQLPPNIEDIADIRDNKSVEIKVSLYCFQQGLSIHCLSRTRKLISLAIDMLPLQ